MSNVNRSVNSHSFLTHPNFPKSMTIEEEWLKRLEDYRQAQRSEFRDVEIVDKILYGRFSLIGFSTSRNQLAVGANVFGGVLAALCGYQNWLKYYLPVRLMATLLESTNLYSNYRVEKYKTSVHELKEIIDIPPTGSGILDAIALSIGSAVISVYEGTLESIAAGLAEGLNFDGGKTGCVKDLQKKRESAFLQRQSLINKKIEEYKSYRRAYFQDKIEQELKLIPPLANFSLNSMLRDPFFYQILKKRVILSLAEAHLALIPCKVAQLGLYLIGSLGAQLATWCKFL